MKIYVSRKDETVKAKLVEYNEKFKTYMVEFITGDRIGKTTSFSASTIKRWWKETESSEEQISPVESITTPVKTPRRLGKKTPCKHLQESSEVKDSLLNTNVYTKYYANVNCIKIYRDESLKKAVLEVYPRNKNVEVRTKQAFPNICENYKDGYNYYLPVHHFISYEQDYMKVLKELISTVLGL